MYKPVQHSPYVQKAVNNTAVISCGICRAARKLQSLESYSRPAPMLHNYHVFEIFPGGSSLWRASIAGRFSTERKLQELAEHSQNEFIALDFSTLNYLRMGAAGTKARPKIENVPSIDSTKPDSAKPNPLPALPGPRAHIALPQPERKSRGT